MHGGFWFLHILADFFLFFLLSLSLLPSFISFFPSSFFLFFLFLSFFLPPPSLLPSFLSLSFFPSFLLSFLAIFHNSQTRKGNGFPPVLWFVFTWWLMLLSSQPFPCPDTNPDSSFHPPLHFALCVPHFLLLQIDLPISFVFSILCDCPLLMLLDTVKSMISTCPLVYLSALFWLLWPDPFHDTPSLSKQR